MAVPICTCAKTGTGEVPCFRLLFTGTWATLAREMQMRAALQRAANAGGYERYSAIVFTTLEVGRVSVGAPPVALTTLSTCSS